jgi:Zn-dependent peptidase ImmA (M78 family)
MQLKQLRAICNKYDINMSSYEDIDYVQKIKIKGMAFRHEDGEMEIIYDGKINNPEAVIAHELGHHIMGHELSYGTGNTNKIKREEFEARVFACVLMALSAFAEVS